MAQSFFASLRFAKFDIQGSSRTAELTWGETESTQRQGNEETPKESRCFALTSNDLLGGGLLLFNFTAALDLLFVCLVKE